MSIRWASDKPQNSRLVGQALNQNDDTDGWVRPADWLQLPAVDGSEQKVVLLMGVFDLPHNPAAIYCQGNFTVDWGDGTIVNYTSATKATHEYDYASISSTTWCSRGYRQVIITITPQSGQNLTRVVLSQPPVNGGGLFAVLDARASVPYATQLLFGSGTPLLLRMLESVELIGSSVANNTAYMFAYCSQLRNLLWNDSWFSSVTNFTNMFYNCSSLTTVPSIDVSSGISLSGMFIYCYSLISVPQLVASSATNFASMFSNCLALCSIPQLDTSSGTNFGSMFSACPSIQEVILSGCEYSINLANCYLDSDALNTIYSNLGTAAGAQTITVTGNPGVGGDDPSIATAKGWTVTGS